MSATAEETRVLGEAEARLFEQLEAPRGAWRSILVVCASAADDGALALAAELAAVHCARLTVAVPIGRPAALASLALVSLEQLGRELEREAQRTACRAARSVPGDVSLAVRTIAPQRERALARELATGAWELYVARARRRGLTARLARRASSAGIPTLLVPRARTSFG